MMNNGIEIRYIIKGNIQHLPPVLRLQTLLPAPILVSKKELFEHIKKKYPDLIDRTFLIPTNQELKQYLTRERVRVAVLPAFTSLRRCIEVQIFHGGLSDKTHLENPLLSLYDLLLFPGQKSVDKVAKAKLLDKVVDWDIVGYPKFDPLIKNQLEYKKYLITIALQFCMCQLGSLQHALKQDQVSTSFHPLARVHYPCGV